MPIKKENAKRYPANWKQLRAAVLERAGNCCEGSPAYPNCRAPNGWLRHFDGQVSREGPQDGSHVSRIVLTIAHLEHDELDTQDINQLRAWCQKCHLTYDAKHHAQNAAQTRHERKAIGELFE